MMRAVLCARCRFANSYMDLVWLWRDGLVLVVAVCYTLHPKVALPFFHGIHFLHSAYLASDLVVAVKLLHSGFARRLPRHAVSSDRLVAWVFANGVNVRDTAFV